MGGSNAGVAAFNLHDLMPETVILQLVPIEGVPLTPLFQSEERRVLACASELEGLRSLPRICNIHELRKQNPHMLFVLKVLHVSFALALLPADFDPAWRFKPFVLFCEKSLCLFTRREVALLLTSSQSVQLKD